VFGSSDSSKTLDDVYAVIQDRKLSPKEGSYVSGLFEKGIDKILKKIGEEAGETVIGAKNEDKKEMIYETADLWFHSLIALAYFGNHSKRYLRRAWKKIRETKRSLQTRVKMTFRTRYHIHPPQLTHLKLQAVNRSLSPVFLGSVFLFYIVADKSIFSY